MRTKNLMLLIVVLPLALEACVYLISEIYPQILTVRSDPLLPSLFAFFVFGPLYFYDLYLVPIASILYLHSLSGSQILEGERKQKRLTLLKAAIAVAYVSAVLAFVITTQFAAYLVLFVLPLVIVAMGFSSGEDKQNFVLKEPRNTA